MLMLGRDEEAINWTQRALAANPNVRPDWRAQYILHIAAAHARLGHFDEAHRLVAEANRIWPYDTARSHFPDDLSVMSMRHRSNASRQRFASPGSEITLTRTPILAWRPMTSCMRTSPGRRQRPRLAPRRFAPTNLSDFLPTENRS